MTIHLSGLGPRLLGAGLALSMLPAPASARLPPPGDLGLLNNGPYASARVITPGGDAIGNALDGVTLTTRQALWSQGSVVAWSDCCASGLGVPRAINRWREVAGYNEGGFDTYPVSWSGAGVAIELPGLPGGNGRGAAGGINDAGLVAGHTRGPDGATRHAVLWQHGVLVRDLGFMGQAGPGLANQSMAHGLNNQGQVVGASLVGSEFHAFLWQDGTFTDLGPGAALGITEDGQTIFGTAPGLIPVVWRNGVRAYLPALGGGGIAYGHTASAMNNKGEVVGFAPSRKPPYQDTAVVWRNGKAINLGRYPGGTVSRAYGLNDKGQVVGEGNLAPDGMMHALRWTLRAGQPPVVELLRP
ncbi:MAG: hypothetical protein ACOZJX_20245 [Pseudomonadota bacterium]